MGDGHGMEGKYTRASSPAFFVAAIYGIANGITYGDGDGGGDGDGDYQCELYPCCCSVHHYHL